MRSHFRPVEISDRRLTSTIATIHSTSSGAARSTLRNEDMRRSFVQRLCRSLVGAMFRDVEVRRDPRHLESGARITVANHFGGGSDGLVLIAVMPRWPRILARAVMWRVPPFGFLADRMRAIPVHQRRDGDGDNVSMFAECFAALIDGDHLLVFPEGVTRDEPSIARVKTGTARIAIGAVEAGASDVVITPVGIHYTDKATMRSDASVHFGPPIIMDEIGETDVRALTAVIEDALRQVSPDFQDWAEHDALTNASDVVLRAAARGESPVSLAERDRLASLLSDTSAEARQRIAGASDDYRRDLDALGIEDEDFVRRASSGSILRKVALDLLIAIVMVPFAVVGAIVSAIPAALVYLVGRLPVRRSVLASAKPVVAVVAFGIAWGIAAWRLGAEYGLSGVAAVLLLMPLYLGAVIILIERVGLAYQALRSLRRRGRVGSLYDRVAADRHAVVAAVAEAF
ncbi:MAG: 1-acyl-sn-glycerol-3-phosphate acyltransferase [Acidimicrobiales bacterium]